MTGAPFLPSLDVLVPLMGEQQVVVSKLLDVAVHEQVVEVPKIFVEDIPSPLSLHEPQLAEQLVEVPRMEDQLVEVSPIVLHVVPQSFFVGADGYGWAQISGPTGVYWWRVSTSHTQWTPPPGHTARPGRDRNTSRHDGGRRCGCGRPCEHAAQVPAVFVHETDSVHQQSGGYSSCYTETGMRSAFRAKTFDIPQAQLLDLVVVPVVCNDTFWYRQCRKQWNCRRCSSCHVVDVAVIIQLVFQQSKSYVTRAIQFDRVPDIPVAPQQSLNKVVDAVVYDSCPWFRQC